MYSYPNNWQHFPNVIWDIVWPYIFVFLLLKCIVSSLLYSYLSIMQLKPSYLFVRIPNLWTLKYIHSKACVPFCVLIIFIEYMQCQRKKKSCESNVDTPTECRTPRRAEFCIYLLTHWIAALLCRRKLLLWSVQHISANISSALVIFTHGNVLSSQPPDLGFFWCFFVCLFGFLDLFFLNKI